MGPKVRYLGPKVPAVDLIWQHSIPPVDHPLVEAPGIAGLKEEVMFAAPSALPRR